MTPVKQHHTFVSLLKKYVYIRIRITRQLEVEPEEEKQALESNSEAESQPKPTVRRKTKRSRKDPPESPTEQLEDKVCNIALRGASQKM